MNRFLVLVLLANLALAHLPPTPASLRRSAAHKKRLDGQYTPPAVALHRRLPLLGEGDRVSILGQSPGGILSVLVNGETITLPADPTETPPPSSSSSDPSSSPSGTATEPPSSSSDLAQSSTTPEPTPSPSDPVTSTSQDCGLLGVLCLTSSSGTPSSTEVPPSTSASDPPQTSQPPSSTDTPSSTTSRDCLLFDIGCLPPSSPVSSDPVSTQPPPASSDPAESQPPPSTTPGDLCLALGIDCPPSSTPASSNLVSTQPPPASSDSVESQQPPPTTTGDLCRILGIGCPPSSTPASSDPVSTQPPPTSSNPAETQPPPSSTTGNLCLALGIGCPSSSVPVNSDPVSSRPPPTSSDPVETQPPTTTGDLCLALGIGCPHSSTQPSSPSSSKPVETQPPPTTTGDLCLALGIGCPPSSTLASSISSQLPLVSSGSLESTPEFSPNLPPSSLPPSSVPSPIPSTTIIIFPSDSSGLPSSSTINSLLITSSPTSAPTPTDTQFEWLTQTSLIFSSISESASDSLSLTDPDQVPTATSFSTAGTPSVAPSVAPLPSGLPARIVPGAGAVNPDVDDLNGFTLIAILFDRGLNWDTVVHNPDSPGQIFSWLPVLIQTGLTITSDQVKSFALQVWIPNSYKGPSDISLLGTTWLGYIPTPLVETLAAQIKVRTSLFYTGQPSPYSDLASHVNPAFDIMTVTATTGIPGSGGPNNGSASGAADDSRTRENAIIGVVSALGGITFIILGYLIYRAIQKRRELAHRRLSDPPTNPFIGEAPPNRNFDQDSIGGQRRRSFYFAEDSLRGFSEHNYTNDGARLSPDQVSGLNRRPVAGNIGPPVMRENSLNF